jgi:type VI secretion system secreted protein VgrG
LLHPRPTVRGTQTAVVVGAGDPTHTDRDLRIKVQFPWQRGSRSASRNGHPLGDENLGSEAEQVLRPV